MQRKIILTPLCKNGMFFRHFSSKPKTLNVELVPQLLQDAKVVIPISMTRYENNRKEFDTALSELFQYTAKRLAQNEFKSVHVIATTALHEDWPESKIAEIDNHFLNTHIKELEKQTGFFLWKDWIKPRKEQHEKYYEEIVELSKSGSEWYKLMVKTYANVSINTSLEASLRYQRQEYAAIRCMTEYTDLVYMGSISLAWAHMYKCWAGLPRFVRASISSQASKIENHDLAGRIVKLLAMTLELTVNNPSLPLKEREKLLEKCFTLYSAYGSDLSMNSVNREMPKLTAMK